MRATAWVLSISLVVACGASEPERDDAGVIADASIDAPGRDAACDDVAAGCVCGDPGATMCFTAQGVQCCGGTWQAFSDGPCAPGPDGGVRACEGREPEAGCPCTIEGDTACRFARWSVVCTEGTWQEQVGRSCC